MDMMEFMTHETHEKEPEQRKHTAIEKQPSLDPPLSVPPQTGNGKESCIIDTLRNKFPQGLRMGSEENADFILHPDSPAPADYNAAAILQGKHIYLATGHEDSLQHEIAHAQLGHRVHTSPPKGSDAIPVVRNLDWEEEANSAALSVNLSDYTFHVEQGGTPELAGGPLLLDNKSLNRVLQSRFKNCKKGSAFARQDFTEYQRVLYWLDNSIASIDVEDRMNPDCPIDFGEDKAKATVILNYMQKPNHMKALRSLSMEDRKKKIDIIFKQLMFDKKLELLQNLARQNMETSKECIEDLRPIAHKLFQSLSYYINLQDQIVYNIVHEAMDDTTDETPSAPWEIVNFLLESIISNTGYLPYDDILFGKIMDDDILFKNIRSQPDSNNFLLDSLDIDIEDPDKLFDSVDLEQLIVKMYDELTRKELATFLLNQNLNEFACEFFFSSNDTLFERFESLKKMYKNIKNINKASGIESNFNKNQAFLDFMEIVDEEDILACLNELLINGGLPYFIEYYNKLSDKLPYETIVAETAIVQRITESILGHDVMSELDIIQTLMEKYPASIFPIILKHLIGLLSKSEMLEFAEILNKTYQNANFSLLNIALNKYSMMSENMPLSTSIAQWHKSIKDSESNDLEKAPAMLGDIQPISDALIAIRAIPQLLSSSDDILEWFSYDEENQLLITQLLSIYFSHELLNQDFALDALIQIDPDFVWQTFSDLFTVDPNNSHITGAKEILCNMRTALMELADPQVTRTFAQTHSFLSVIKSFVIAKITKEHANDPDFSSYITIYNKTYDDILENLNLFARMERPKKKNNSKSKNGKASNQGQNTSSQPRTSLSNVDARHIIPAADICGLFSLIFSPLPTVVRTKDDLVLLATIQAATAKLKELVFILCSEPNNYNSIIVQHMQELLSGNVTVASIKLLLSLLVNHPRNIFEGSASANRSLLNRPDPDEQAGAVHGRDHVIALLQWWEGLMNLLNFHPREEDIVVTDKFGYEHTIHLYVSDVTPKKYHYREKAHEEIHPYRLHQ